MEDAKVSRRGVYYDLTISPYEVCSPCGDIFKFPSQKKLDMYRRDVQKEAAMAARALRRWGFESLPAEIEAAVYSTVYKRITGNGKE